MTTETCVLLPEIRENKLIIPDSTEGLKLTDFMPVLRRYEEINKTLVFEYRDDKGNKDARSHVAKLRKIKAPIATINKELKAEYKAIIDQMDKDKRDALAIVENMIEHHDRELKIVAEEEKAEAERKRIEQEIIDCWDVAHEMNAMVDQQRELDRKAAEQARIAEQQAEEQRRLQIERDKKEAADKAAEEARLAEQARSARAIKEAEEKAERERAEAEAKALQAKLDAENAIREATERAEKEKEEALAQAERDKAAEAARIKATENARIAAEEAARRDQENIERVHNAIVSALEAVGIFHEDAIFAVKAMRDGRIPAVSIDYQWVDDSFPM